MCGIVGYVLGQRHAIWPLGGHDPHFQWSNRQGQPPAKDRQPMAFGEVEEHRRVATARHHTSRGGFRLEPTRLQPIAALHAPHAVLAVEDEVRRTVGVEHRRRVGALFDPTTRLLATLAIAGRAQDRRAHDFQHDIATLARRGQGSVRLDTHQHSNARKRTFAVKVCPSAASLTRVKV